ncbi:ABC transporter permease [Mycoplasma todarodis]|uniref:Peptide ABC transporter permease n=1 Tax=Mycoplasma todarodis TaxID=1937191 RepID=A0A4V2NI44_9MOLU|nr:ABC transporter permease [Mycoplasma todarodis]TCG10928.1 peptide ABC transporter permease [Mycoplasma todarodis]
MFKYILKRLALLLLSLFIVVTITFFLMDLMPGYPKALEDASMKPHAPKIEVLAKEYGLNDPIFERYGRYLSGIFHLKFGDVYNPTYKGTTIPNLFFKPLKYSMLVTVPAFVISTVLGVVLGFIAGYKRGKWQDTLINVFVMLFVAVPSFIWAIFLMLIGTKVGLPVAFEEALGASFEVLSLILPIITLTLGGMATLTYYTRNEVVEILKSDFISIARSKGLSEKQIITRHVFRNVSIPLVSIILPMFVTLLTGSLIIERFFAVPGTSSVIVLAVQNKETYIILFSILFYSSLTMLVQLLVDVLYVFIDPRIKIAQSQKMSIFKRMKLASERKKAFNEANSKGGK